MSNERPSQSSVAGIPVAAHSEPRIQRPRRAAPADAVRPTRAEVNLAALRHNLRVVSRAAQGSQVWPVLKADGYGHGAPAVARTLERAGAHGFCVALLEEGIELREAGIRAPILVMGGYYGDAYRELIERQMIPVVYDLAQAEGFARLVRSGDVQGPVEVHLKLDTGMARLGVPVAEASTFAARLSEIPEVKVSGLMTHLACADAASTQDLEAQMLRFDEATGQVARHGIRPSVRHAANSAAVLRGAAKLDWARPGVALFGVSPRAVVDTRTLGEPFSSELQPVMRVRSEIVALRQVPAGQHIGYGGLWKAERPSLIATVPVGYADGLSRQVTNRAAMLVRGARARVAGAVSMDLTMIDVTDVPGVALRDEVVVLGEQEGPLGTDAIAADELAAHSGTIAWEVMTHISRRVPRFYREP